MNMTSWSSWLVQKTSFHSICRLWLLLFNRLCRWRGCPCLYWSRLKNHWNDLWGNLRRNGRQNMQKQYPDNSWDSEICLVLWALMTLKLRKKKTWRNTYSKAKVRLPQNSPHVFPSPSASVTMPKAKHVPFQGLLRGFLHRLNCLPGGAVLTLENLKAAAGTFMASTPAAVATLAGSSP